MTPRVELKRIRIATAPELDLAMTKGVNYPKGLLQWCDEIGAGEILRRMDALYDRFRDDRYRASVGLRFKVEAKPKS